MEMVKCANCAIQEISGLMWDSAETNMERFCTLNFKGTVKFGYLIKSKNNALYSFYLFSAGVTHKGEAIYGESYAQDFMNLIKKHRLGKVWKSPVVQNVAFHPDHSNQVFIWMPNEKALRAWWNKRCKP